MRIPNPAQAAGSPAGRNGEQAGSPGRVARLGWETGLAGFRPVDF